MINFDLLLARITRMGSLIGLSLLVLGTILMYSNYITHKYFRHDILFYGQMIDSQNISFYRVIDLGDPVSLMFLGVVVLIATPIMRTAAQLAEFIWQKDKLYIGLTLLVLIFLFSAIFIMPHLLSI